jgi:hypothetical protein
MAYTRDECLEFAKQYVDASRDASSQFDARLFWLAGGAIGLSAVFVQRVNGHLHYPWLLAVSWASLLFGVLMVVISFQLAIRVYQEWISYWMRQADGEADKAKEHRGDALRLAECTTGLNWAALAAIVLGLVFLCVFVPLNR